jgi:putative transposase
MVASRPRWPSCAPAPPWASARCLRATANPNGNADTERFLRTLKEELVWLREWTSPGAFFAALDLWLAHYNASYLHSALGYRAQNVVEAEHLGHATPLAAAC